MKVSTAIRWIGPAAIAGGLLMAFSDLLNLTIYVPGLGEAAHTGYEAVGLGVILMAMTLLLVGMLGLYAARPTPGGARVIEYGDAHARYVLVEEDHGYTQARTDARRRSRIVAEGLALRSGDARGPAARSHRGLPRVG